MGEVKQWVLISMEKPDIMNNGKGAYHLGIGVEQRNCPLCGKEQAEDYCEDRRRLYFHCGMCDLVFVPPEYRLSPELEKSEYDLHDNRPDDPGYRRFLSRLAKPLLEKLKPGLSGLDFGCGPGPTLSVMMEEAGHTVDLYDHFYCSDSSVFQKRYDFITASEVVEHLGNPKRVFAQLFQMLKPGAPLGIMTKLHSDPQSFKNWHYIQDPTHICFYSRRTFQYLSEIYHLDIEFIGRDVIILCN